MGAGRRQAQSCARNVFWKGAESHAVWATASPIVWNQRAESSSVPVRHGGDSFVPTTDASFGKTSSDRYHLHGPSVHTRTFIPARPCIDDDTLLDPARSS